MPDPVYDVEWLVSLYGDNPQEVGVDHEKGNEDDYGDLLVDATVVLLGSDAEDDLDRVAAAAGGLDRRGVVPTTMAAWIEALRAELA